MPRNSILGALVLCCTNCGAAEVQSASGFGLAELDATPSTSTTRTTLGNSSVSETNSLTGGTTSSGENSSSGSSTAEASHNDTTGSSEGELDTATPDIDDTTGTVETSETESSSTDDGGETGLLPDIPQWDDLDEFYDKIDCFAMSEEREQVACLWATYPGEIAGNWIALIFLGGPETPSILIWNDDDGWADEDSSTTLLDPAKLQAAEDFLAEGNFVRAGYPAPASAYDLAPLSVRLLEDDNPFVSYFAPLRPVELGERPWGFEGNMEDCVKRQVIGGAIFHELDIAVVHTMTTDYFTPWEGDPCTIEMFHDEEYGDQFSRISVMEREPERR